MSDQPLVSARSLAEHLSDPQLVVVDCRFALSDPDLGRRQYAAGHIPGAHYLDLNQDLSGPVQTHGGRHPLPDLAAFQVKLEAMGVSSDPPTQVVAYDDSAGAFAARLWWLLRYLGHPAVAVLNGGLGAWQRAGYGLSAEHPNPQPGRFQPRLQSDWAVDRTYVRQRRYQPGVVLIDSRAPERYRGEIEPIDPIAGSVPGAVNSFWKDVVDERGEMSLQAQLQAHWSHLDVAEEVIVYCGSGVTACVNLLSLAVAAKPMARLYVGGWSDWCSYEDRE